MAPGGGALATAVLVVGTAGGALLGLAVLDGDVPDWRKISWASRAGEAMDCGDRVQLFA